VHAAAKQAYIQQRGIKTGISSWFGGGEMRSLESVDQVPSLLLSEILTLAKLSTIHSKH
jgi:hypothetical protein